MWLYKETNGEGFSFPTQIPDLSEIDVRVSHADGGSQLLFSETGVFRSLHL